MAKRTYRDFSYRAGKSAGTIGSASKRSYGRRGVFNPNPTPVALNTKTDGQFDQVQETKTIEDSPLYGWLKKRFGNTFGG